MLCVHFILMTSEFVIFYKPRFYFFVNLLFFIFIAVKASLGGFQPTRSVGSRAATQPTASSEICSLSASIL